MSKDILKKNNSKKNKSIDKSKDKDKEHNNNHLVLQVLTHQEDYKILISNQI